MSIIAEMSDAEVTAVSPSPAQFDVGQTPNRRNGLKNARNVRVSAMPQQADAAVLSAASLPPPHAEDRPVRVSAILTELVDAGMPDQVSLGWLLGHLEVSSFGAAMLVLGIAGMAPLISVPAGLLLIPLAGQLIAGHRNVVLPAAIAARPISSKRIGPVLRGASVVCRHIERFIRPRGRHVFGMNRLIGVIVLLLALTMFIPVPFSNLVPGFAIAMIALGYLERDGLLLALSLIAASVALVVALGTIYGLAVAAM